MSGIFGALSLNDNDRVMLSSIGQRVVFDAINSVLGDHNADVQQALGVFVQETTSDYKIRYKLPGGGRLQKLGNLSQAAAVKAYGSWDVAFPLEDYGAALAFDRVSYAYMDTRELDRHLNTIMAQNTNTVRFELLKTLFYSTQRTWADPIYGNLTLEPLANGDSVVYPPVLGSETEATHAHYLESGYASSAISDTNNPYATISSELEEHFGAPTGGSNIAVFINNAQVAKTRVLTDFVPVSDFGINPGDDTATVTGLPAAVPGRVLGRMDGSGVWVIEWRWIPADYMFGIHLDAPRPVMQRIDPADTGLPQGLALVGEDGDYPFRTAHYSHRFGFGVGNRLNGVALELGVGGGYTIPTAYA